jgi:PAS domain S-box-containing protein
MSKSKILIVEDERITAEDLKNTLESLGYEVTGIASSSDSFYTCLHSMMPDLVLMDIFLKGKKDGIELATEVKAKYQLPVIFLTAYSDPNILERAKISEPFGYILKPFQERELHSNIEMASHKNRMEKHINHLNAILKAIRDVNQLIVRENNTKELLQKTCETLISTRAYSSAWFLILDEKGQFLDVSSAGLKENKLEFVQQFKNGIIPPCITVLNESHERVYSIHSKQDCGSCSMADLYPETGSIICKVQYQQKLYGYLAVSMPGSQVNDVEELNLFIEISDDLGLALSNIEHQKKKEEAEEALKISEEKFRALYENAPLSYQSLDEHGCFIDVNPTWEKTLGYTREEVIGKWYGDFLHPDFVEHFRINFPAFKKRGNVSDVQFRLRKKTGGYIYVSFEGCIGYNPDGTFRQTYCVFKDITDQKKAEENLKDSRDQLQTLINAMPDLVCFKDGEGKWLVANDYALKLFGLTDVDYKGKTDTELIEYNSFYKEAFLECEATDAMAWEKGTPIRHDKTFPLPDGNTMIFDSIKIPSFDSHGKRKGMVVVERDITERIKAEQELLKLSQVVEQSPFSIIVTGIDGNIEYVNFAACQKSGYTFEELKGKSPDLFNSGEMSDTEYSKMWEQIKQGKEWKGEFHNRNKTGELYWERASISPLKNDKGEISHFLSIQEDISERKQVDQELQKLSQVVQQSPDSIIVTDTNGIIEYVNPVTCQVTGYSSEELLGLNPDILSSGETSGSEYKVLWDTIKAGNDWKGEFHNRKKNGDLYWERATISAIKNSKGEITHFLGIKEDITERKRNETIQKVLYNISKQAFETTDLKQLFEIIKNELNLLINTSNFFVALHNETSDMLTAAYVSDDNDKIETWPAKKSLTGYVVRQNKSLLLKDADFQKLVETGEVELIGVDSEIWLGVPLVADGKAFGAIVVQDYHNPNAFGESELKMLEFIARQVSLSIQRQESIANLQNAFAKADAGDRLKTAFINNISHEIRTPLNGILGFTEMTLNPESTPEDKELFFTVIKKSSKRLLNTVTSYMDISMLVSGTLEIIRRPSNIDKLLHEIYNDFREPCTTKNIELKIVKPDVADSQIISTDIEKLRKIITHLLDNAVKFTQKGTVEFGYISTMTSDDTTEMAPGLNQDSKQPVTEQSKSNGLQFFVSDTGTGIKPEALNVIFDAFMQADVSSTRGYEGSGLGLTIASKMISHLGGKLWVDSERGRGSTFYFSLPFSENPVLTPVINTVKPKSDSAIKPLILVAEDDDSNYKYIEIVLLYASYDVIRAENGIEAVDNCRDHPEIRLVLMDIKMPMMDGFEATRQIRSFRPDLPVIALTAHVTTEDESAALAAGCSEYVTKPVSKVKLLEIIEYSLNSAN